MGLLKVLLLTVIASNCANSAKILGIFNAGSYSHFILAHPVLQELSSRGHEVTMISPFKKDAKSTYRVIELTGMKEQFDAMIKRNSGNKTVMDMISIPTPMMAFFMQEMGVFTTQYTLNHPNVQNLLSSKEKFDLIIIEQFFNDALKGFCHHFDAPCIAFNTIGSSLVSNYVVGNPAPTSFVPNRFLSYSSEMKFVERVYNTFFSIYCYIVSNTYYVWKQNAMLHKYFPNAPHINTLVSNQSLMFLNSHSSTSEPVPHMPNMIEIGGVHIDEPKKLPVDLQKYMDDAKEGVVYFSLGSNVKSKDLSKDKRESIFRALGKLKLKVLWKFEEDALPGKPDNVKISKWFPQTDILAHPNLKLFITHGGMLSLTEAVYFGVPLIGVPFVGDQRNNMALVVKKGLGVKIDFIDLNEEILGEALNKILKDKTFTETAKRLSEIHHDRPMKPLDTAMYWIEYVLKHKGAYHLKSASADLTWYQYHSIDVFAFVAFATASVLLPIFALLVCLKRMLCGRKCKDAKVGQTKKKKTN